MENDFDEVNELELVKTKLTEKSSGLILDVCTVELAWVIKEIGLLAYFSGYALMFALRPIRQTFVWSLV